MIRCGEANTQCLITAVSCGEYTNMLIVLGVSLSTAVQIYTASGRLFTMLSVSVSFCPATKAVTTHRPELSARNGFHVHTQSVPRCALKSNAREPSRKT